MSDYYSVLGIERGATEHEIKRAYRGLARKFHPDVAHDKIIAEVRFKEINEAYEVLSDPNKRQQYDRFGHVPGAAGGAGGFGPFGAGEGIGDIFDMFFGGRQAAPQRPAGPQRGADLRYDLQITLEDAYRGAEREISFHHLSGCETCHGSGAKPGTSTQRCDRCNGSGTARTVRQTPLGQFVTQSPCTKCGGEGERIPSPCETCRGRGRVEKTRTLTVKIPGGVDDGSRIRIGGSGEGGMRGGPAGDLYVYLSIARDARYRREAADLFVDEPISFTKAALGGPLEIETFDGPAEVAIAGGTQTGSSYRLRGRGMPNVRGGSRGDLIVTVHVVVPTKTSRKERDLLEAFAELHDDRVETRSFFERVKDAFKTD
ncbi:MAG: molecular chaperone DnaJ [Candidatus Eremiobacteraeota bacterium]|nr:molecular chaperone DnaJ [Candidatus Eremiobacteraeota bacterium]